MHDEQCPIERTTAHISTNQPDLDEGSSKTAAYFSDKQTFGASTHIADAASFHQSVSGSNSNDQTTPSDAIFAMVGLGLEEPLPIQEAQDDLYAKPLLLQFVMRLNL